MAGRLDLITESMQTPFITRQEIGSILDEWYAKKQPLQQEKAAPNLGVYSPSYGQSAAAPQQQSAPQIDQLFYDQSPLV